MKILLVGAKFFYANGRTDRQTNRHDEDKCKLFAVLPTCLKKSRSVFFLVFWTITSNILLILFTRCLQNRETNEWVCGHCSRELVYFIINSEVSSYCSLLFCIRWKPQFFYRKHSVTCYLAIGTNFHYYLSPKIGVNTLRKVRVI